MIENLSGKKDDTLKTLARIGLVCEDDTVFAGNCGSCGTIFATSANNEAPSHPGHRCRACK